MGLAAALFLTVLRAGRVMYTGDRSPMRDAYIVAIALGVRLTPMPAREQISSANTTSLVSRHLRWDDCFSVQGTNVPED